MTFIVDNIVDKRKDKVGNVEELRSFLMAGNHFYGPKAKELGLIDGVTTPDAFFKEHFAGEKYTIGETKLSIWQKLGLDKGSKSELFFETMSEELRLEEQMMSDPVTQFHQNALTMPHIGKDSFF